MISAALVLKVLTPVSAIKELAYLLPLELDGFDGRRPADRRSMSPGTPRGCAAPPAASSTYPRPHRPGPGDIWGDYSMYMVVR